MRKVLVLLATAILAKPLTAQGRGGALDQDSAGVATISPTRRGPDGRLQVDAAPTSAPLRVDGVLDEPVWQVAEPVGNFVQSEPHEGRPASEATEVRIAYDDRNLYIGAVLHDDDPRGPIVNDIRKDFQQDDQDTFELILDTFADRRNGYVFITNAGGGKADQQIANEGKEINASWDAPWQVRTRRDADGWTAEIAIPFRALRSSRSAEAGARIWGINFSRRIRRRNEIDFWAPVPRSYTLSRVSLAGDLTGLPQGVGGRDLRLKPYVAARTVRETGTAAYSQTGDVGLDLKYGLTDALTLDVTANPDFAQAEADEQQVNLTQFSQFFPEKREFFLENSGVFYVGDAARSSRVNLVPTPDEDLLLFFSRRIGLDDDGLPVPIRGGARLTGRVAGLTIGALGLRTGASGGAAGGDYGVVRLRRNVFAASDVGAFLLMRSEAGGGDYDRVYGVDSNFRVLGSVDWSSYIARSASPGAAAGRYAFRTSLNHEGNASHLKLGMMSIGEGFRDDLGFYRRVGSRKWFIDTGLRPRPALLQRYGIREMHPHIVWSYYTDQQGRIIGKRLHSGYTFFLSDGGYFEVSVNPEYERIDEPLQLHPNVEPLPDGGYAWTDYQLKGSTDPSRVVSVSLTGITGGLWSGHQKTVDASITVQPSFHFRTTVGMQRTSARLDVPAEEFVRSLWTARANYSFNTRAFVDALVQYDPATHELNSNVRFNVIHHPLSDLFIVYNEQRITSPGGVPTGRGIVVKVTQMLGF